MQYLTRFSTRKVGWQPGSRCSGLVGWREREILQCLSMVVLRVPNQLDVAMQQYFFTVITQSHFKDVYITGVVPSCTTFDLFIAPYSTQNTSDRTGGNLKLCLQLFID